jgi:pyruvate dehydrogenase E2 component (dihydrolipoamide acetyltransferase)
MSASNDVLMPRLSDSMEDGTILTWLIDDGQPVAAGEELVEIETDKATMTHASELEGILEVVAEAGETVAVGAVIARVGPLVADASSPPDASSPGAPLPADESSPGASPPADAASPDTSSPAAPVPAAASANGSSERDEPVAPVVAHAAGPGSGAGASASASAAVASVDGGSHSRAPVQQPRARATPLATRLARAHDVSLAMLAGSGPRGRITRRDVLDAAGIDDGRRAKGALEVQELSRTQRVIARRMSETKATVPDFQVQADVAMNAAIELREELRAIAAGDAAPSFNDMIIKACAIALRAHPRVNGSYRDGRFELHERVGIGIAVAAEDALVVPTLPDADVKSLAQIAREGRRLAERVRSGEITPAELSGATFTVSNLGMFGMTAITPVINSPQAAILGVGALRDCLARSNGEIVDRTLLTLTLACDHRILYGADAAAFLSDVKDTLERPLTLML